MHADNLSAARSSTASSGSLNLLRLLGQSWKYNSTLTITTILSILLIIVAAVGMLVDPRLVLGVSTWAKSAKFGISIALYGATLLWMLPMVTRWPRLAQLVAHGSGGLLMLEIVLLFIQGARGVPMHFNVSTPFDQTLWQIMGSSITVFWLVTVLGAGLLLFQKLPNRVLAWSIRLGMLIVIVGFTEGFLMPQPNAAQLAALEAGQHLDLIGAHTVGAFDGGPGLPFMGWSTNHGDLRVGHFIGIHGVQVIALLAVLLLRRKGYLTDAHRLALVSIGAASYLGLVALATWQALRDQPLLAPDALTLGLLGGLIAVAVTLAGGVLLHARSRTSALSVA